MHKQMQKGERKWVSYDLEFYPLTVELDGPDLEVNADSGDKGRRPCVVAEPKQQTGLSNTFGQVKGYKNGDGKTYPSLQSARASSTLLGFTRGIGQSESAYLDEEVIMGRWHGVLP
jgi:hypothetical protein